MGQGVSSLASGAAVTIDPSDRLLAPSPPPSWLERFRPAALFALFAAFHVGALALLFVGVGFDPPSPPSEEIAVEVASDPSPQPAPEPPPPQPQQPEQKPPIDLKPGIDAPRAPNKETVDREAPDAKTTTPVKGEPSEQAAMEKPPQDRPDTAKPSPATPAPVASELKPSEAPDAEPAAVAEDSKPTVEAKADPAPPKPVSKPGNEAFERQLASWEATPTFHLGAVAMPSPVSGGNAKATYFSILYGLIIPHFQRPPVKGPAQGRIAIYIDTAGHILHQGVVETSGYPDLDAAAMEAVRKGAPFPPPPTNMPPVIFTYTAKK
jgi:protein TonB